MRGHEVDYVIIDEAHRFELHKMRGLEMAQQMSPAQLAGLLEACPPTTEVRATVYWIDKADGTEKSRTGNVWGVSVGADGALEIKATRP